MLVTDRSRSMEQAPISEVDISKIDKVPVSKMTVDIPVALILHRLPLADTDHIYGAVVRIDQLDAGDVEYHTLSGTHEGACDVSACRTPSESFELTMRFDVGVVGTINWQKTFIKKSRVLDSLSIGSCGSWAGVSMLCALWRIQQGDRTGVSM